MAAPNAACPAEITNTCAQRHWAIYWLLIFCSVAMVGGRVLTVQNFSAEGDTPFFSANDRSRWVTIRALGDEGVYEIDSVIEDATNTIRWNSIDKVRHIGRDGELHYYSSKPTLLPTMLAWKYKLVKALTGWNLSENTLETARFLLVLTNVIPWLVALWLFGLTIDRIPVRDWTRYYVLAVACFGTFLTTFLVSLNNHTPAAISVIVAVYCLAQIWREDTVLEDGQYVSRKYQAHWWVYLVAGLFSAFAAANELPALSFLGLAGLACLVQSPLKTFLAFVPGVAIVAAAFFGTNYQAHQEWKPAYAHRGDGPVIATVEGELAEQLDSGRLPKSIQEALPDGNQFVIPRVEKGAWPSTSSDQDRWVVRDANGSFQVAITSDRSSVEGTSSTFEIRKWNNWYDYPGSYWLSVNDENKSSVDRGQSDLLIYAFHIFFGHHGIFSLTPVWLLSFAGMLGLMFKPQLKLRWLGAMAIILTLVVLAFYLRRPEIDRNYGGVTSGLRWLFWLVPLWLIAMMPVVDWLGKTTAGRWVCYLLLLFSAISALYSANNPWVHPWLYEIWGFTGLPL